MMEQKQQAPPWRREACRIISCDAGKGGRIHGIEFEKANLKFEKPENNPPEKQSQRERERERSTEIEFEKAENDRRRRRRRRRR